MNNQYDIKDKDLKDDYTMEDLYIALKDIFYIYDHLLNKGTRKNLEAVMQSVRDRAGYGKHV